jgi:hypothetical protein
MGSKEIRRIPKHACIGRLVIVALSAQPPGVNELCVCVLYKCQYSGNFSTGSMGKNLSGDSDTSLLYFA